MFFDDSFKNVLKRGYLAESGKTIKNMVYIIVLGVFYLFLIQEGELPFKNGDYLFFPDVRKAVADKADSITGYAVKENGLKEFQVTLGELTDDEREIILKGCLINYNRK